MFSSKKDRRKNKRYNVDSIHGNLLYSTDINIVDISMGGAAIETYKRLSIDREYSLKIKYKDKILGLKGLIVWSLLSRTETQKAGGVIPVYKSGMRFTNVVNELKIDLMKFIDENKSESLEKRNLAVRFKIEKVDEAVIDDSYDYNIKQISLSGMLIESENSFDVESHCNFEILLDGRVLSSVGRVVNCVEISIENSSLYHIGIEFIKMSDEDRSFLKNFLESLDDVKNKD